MVVADEGHQIKNPATKRFAAVTSLKTKRRIALTGYPLQNNMDEYYTMIMWCTHDLLGNPAWFHDTFSKPIHEGEFARRASCISCCAVIIATALCTSLAVSMGNLYCTVVSSYQHNALFRIDNGRRIGYTVQHTCCMPIASPCCRNTSFTVPWRF